MVVIQVFLCICSDRIPVLCVHQVIQHVQNLLTPDRANILILSKKYQEECTENEPWFQTPYDFSGLYFI